MGLPFLGGIGVFLFTLKRKKLLHDHVALKYSKANAVAQKRLIKAKVFVAENNAKAFYDETIKFTFGVVMMIGGKQLAIPGFSVILMYWCYLIPVSLRRTEHLM